jgi:hypothetical protein
MIITKPNSAESFGFFSNYINKVTTNDLIAGLFENKAIFIEKIAKLSPEQLVFAYAPGKWTLIQAIGHVIDTERIFAYRILRFARKDKTPLPGFDEGLFVENSFDSSKSIEKLIREFEAVRNNTICLLEGLDESVLDEVGTASNFQITTRALGYATLGHCIHHLGIIDERYLV